MNKANYYIGLILILCCLSDMASAQIAIGYVSVEANDGLLDLRVISVADAISAGNGVVKIKLTDGTVGAADLVVSNHYDASPVRIQTPYGIRSWRKESLFAYAYGGVMYDFITDMVLSSDSMIVMGGVTDSWGTGANNQWLIKTNRSGSVSLSGAYGSTTSRSCQGIVEISGGGYLLLGTAQLIPEYYMYVNFLDESGTSVLNGYYVPETGLRAGNDVIECSDGNFIGVGYADGFGAGNTDVYLKKFDLAGYGIWAWATGEEGYERGNDVIERPDGGLVVVGWTNPIGEDRNACYIHFDSGGALENSYSIGGSDMEEAAAVTKSVENGYVFTGFTTSFGAGEADFYMVKRAPSGAAAWSRTFGGTNHDGGYDISLTNDGGFALVGYTYSFGAGNRDIWLIKTDSLGNPEWSWVFGGTGNDAGYAVEQDANGYYYVSGSTNSYGAGAYDAILVKFTSDGSTCIGYALGFGSEMQPMDSKDNPFKAQRIDNFLTTTVSDNERIMHPNTRKLKEKFQITDENGSRELITPTQTTICN